MKLIPLGNNHFTQVSDSQYPRLSKFKWRLMKTHENYSIVIRNFQVNKKIYYCIMSRFILSAPDGKLVDHIDGNPLNNQNENLRLCTNAENCRNTKIYKNNTSGYKGVQSIGKQGKWFAIINCNRKQKYIGTFETKEEAAMAYNEYAKKLHGEFARLNVIPTKSV